MTNEQSAKFQAGNPNKPTMDSVNMTTETTGIGGFIGTATSTTNNQGGMTTITANVDPVQNKVMEISQTIDILSGCNR